MTEKHPHVFYCYDGGPKVRDDFFLTWYTEPPATDGRTFKFLDFTQKSFLDPKTKAWNAKDMMIYFLTNVKHKGREFLL